MKVAFTNDNFERNCKVAFTNGNFGRNCKVAFTIVNFQKRPNKKVSLTIGSSWKSCIQHWKLLLKVVFSVCKTTFPSLETDNFYWKLLLSVTTFEKIGKLSIPMTILKEVAKCLAPLETFNRHQNKRVSLTIGNSNCKTISNFIFSQVMFYFLPSFVFRLSLHNYNFHFGRSCKVAFTICNFQMAPNKKVSLTMTQVPFIIGNFVKP